MGAVTPSNFRTNITQGQSGAIGTWNALNQKMNEVTAWAADAGVAEYAYTATDTPPTDAQALAAYGEGGYFTIDDPTVLTSPGANVDATSMVVSALAFSRSVKLNDGVFLINSPLGTLAAGQSLTGNGSGSSIIRLKSTYTGGPPLTIGGKGCTISKIGFIGGSNATNCKVNPSVDCAISLGTGWMNSTISDVDFNGVNGYCIKGVSTGLGYYGLFINNIRGMYDGGGFYLDSSATSDHNVQGSISNVNLQIMQTGSLFRFITCTDIVGGNIDGCVAGDVVGAHDFHLSGDCSTIIFNNVDVGSYPTVPSVDTIVEIEGTPNNVIFNGGILQSGLNAIRVSGPSDSTLPLYAQCRNVFFRGMHLSRSARAAVRVDGGTNVVISDSVFEKNGLIIARTVTDAVLVNGSPTIASDTAAFKSSDVGAYVAASTGMNTGVNAPYLTAVATDGKSATMSAAATGSSTGLTVTIGVNVEVQVTDPKSVVEISRNKFCTPAVLGDVAFGQVTNVFRGVSSNLVSFRNNDILGGHAQSAVFSSGAPPKYIRDNPGYNPVGWYTSSQVPVPASGANTSGTSVDRIFYVTAATGGCQVQVFGGPSANAAQTLTIAAGATVPVTQVQGSTLKFTYTTAPTILVYGM